MLQSTSGQFSAHVTVKWSWIAALLRVAQNINASAELKLEQFKS